MLLFWMFRINREQTEELHWVKQQRSYNVSSEMAICQSWSSTSGGWLTTVKAPGYPMHLSFIMYHKAVTWLRYVYSETTSIKRSLG